MFAPSSLALFRGRRWVHHLASDTIGRRQRYFGSTRELAVTTHRALLIFVMCSIAWTEDKPEPEFCIHFSMRGHGPGNEQRMSLYICVDP